MEDFGNKIISWYQVNKRDLPWRNTDNPYYIWLSEIILQQTRVEQGLPYYLKFIENFPTINDLANAGQDEVLRNWQGLGYYSRGRNLHFTAKQIMKDYGGKFPTSFNDLIKLKGVGVYTASAVSSFCSNEPRAVVDGNVYRVLARYFGIESDISSTVVQKEFQLLANDLLNKQNAALYNQSLMEFGALQCVPKNPNCSRCPLVNSCVAFAQNKVDLLPQKVKKVKNRSRYFYYLIITDGIRTLIQKRRKGDIWEGLYEFPLLEFSEEADEKVILNSTQFNKLVDKKKYQVSEVSLTHRHKLTHQTIYCRFFKILMKNLANIHDFEIVSWKALDTYPKPALIQKYYQNFKL